MPKPRLLIVEDSPVLMRAYRRFFSKEFECVCFAEAEAAIDWLGTENVSAILSDFELAGKETGGDLYQWAKDNVPEVPFVFLTGSIEQVPAESIAFEKPQNLKDIAVKLGG